jgi:hypothetical protein
MSEAAYSVVALIGSDTPIKVLAVVGGAALGALLSGVALQVGVKLAFAQQVPRWPLWGVRGLGGLLFGFLVYLWLFGGGGGGIGGPGGWFGGSGKDGARNREGTEQPRPKDKSTDQKSKDKDREKKDKEKDRDGKSAVPEVELLQVEVLGNDALKKISRSDTFDSARCYRIKGQTRLLSLEEVRKLILERRMGKPGLRKLEIFVYLDSPATDKPQVVGLESWARDLDPQRGKLEVELRAPDRNAPVD